MNELEEDSKNEFSSHDFGKDIITNMFPVGNVYVYVYDFTKNIVPGDSEVEIGYWRDVGTIDEYWQANMDLLEVQPIFII